MSLSDNFKYEGYFVLSKVLWNKEKTLFPELSSLVYTICLFGLRIADVFSAARIVPLHIANR